MRQVAPMFCFLMSLVKTGCLSPTKVHSRHLLIPGTCVQYPGLQCGSALGDASIPGTPAGSMAASVRGGTYSHVAVVGGASGGERGAASTTAAAAARQRRAMPTGGAVTPPHGAPAHGERGGRHGARAGGCTALGRTVATMEFYIFARNSLSGPLCEIIFFVHRRFAVKCERGSCLLLQRSRATLPTDKDAEIISDPSIEARKSQP